MEATIDIDPNTLNFKSEGEWITCYIEFPVGYDVNDIDVSTILLDNIIYAELDPVEIGDFDGDSILELMVKFDRPAVIDYLEGQGVQHREEVMLTVTGYLYGGTLFEGSDMIRVNNK